jgi:hypothetical protein
MGIPELSSDDFVAVICILTVGVCVVSYMVLGYLAGRERRKEKRHD